MRNNKVLKNILISIFFLISAYIISYGMQNILSARELVPAVFVLAVFLTSLATDSYSYGLISSLISVLAVNHSFSYPYFKFNFTIPENIVSAVIMIVVTALTCALTKKIRHQEAINAENEKEKVRANLLRAISHDLRTPLTSIYGASSTISENYTTLSDSDKLTMLHAIREDSQWLIHVLENILSVTKFDSGTLKLIKSSTVLEELVDSAISKFNKRYPAVNVNVDIPDEFVTISVDPILIEQVIINLLDNAVQHAKGMSKLSLTVFTLGSRVIFEVSDDGAGIDGETLKNLFTSFIQTKPSHDSKPRSMGIGLSICSTIIKAHGGSIKAENRKGGGATIRFSLTLENN